MLVQTVPVQSVGNSEESYEADPRVVGTLVVALVALWSAADTVDFDAVVDIEDIGNLVERETWAVADWLLALKAMVSRNSSQRCKKDSFPDQQVGNRLAVHSVLVATSSGLSLCCDPSKILFPLGMFAFPSPLEGFLL